MKDGMTDAVSQDFSAKFDALIIRAATIRSKSTYPLPKRASEAVRRIEAGMESRDPLSVFTMISDLSYFIGYMEALTDPKGGK